MLAAAAVVVLVAQDPQAAAALATPAVLGLEVQQLDMDPVAVVLGLVVPEELVDLDLLVSSLSVILHNI